MALFKDSATPNFPVLETQQSTGQSQMEANALGLQQRGPHLVKNPVAGKLSKFEFLFLKKICVSMFLHT